MGQDTFNKLCTELEHYRVKRDTCFQKAVPLQQREAVMLWKLGTNVEYITLAQLMGIGRSTAGVDLGIFVTSSTLNQNMYKTDRIT